MRNRLTLIRHTRGGWGRVFTFDIAHQRSMRRALEAYSPIAAAFLPANREKTTLRVCPVHDG